MDKIIKWILVSVVVTLATVGEVARATYVYPRQIVAKEVNVDILNLYGRDEDRLRDALINIADHKIALDYISSGLGDKVVEVAREVERDARGDSIIFEPNTSEKFRYIPARSGIRVKWDEVYLDAIEVLYAGGGEVRVHTESVPAEIKYDKGIENYTTLRSSFVTYFNMDNTSRVHNITLASSSISGVVVRAGERFSFNEVVGKRTLGRGYRVAPVIVKGELVEGVGGGVCQVSTTLYNAVTLAGLKSVCKVAHSMPVTYVEPSRDVTVSEHIDYAFVNDSGEDIYIECVARANYIKVNIYGVRTDEHIDIDTEYIDEDGYRYSTAYIVTTKRGVVVSRSKLRSDKYLLPSPTPTT
ncbi:MAG: VanW family protein [Clostridia bacterium]|nr:VanW family protein [Clostridia bacterium]